MEAPQVQSPLTVYDTDILFRVESKDDQWEDNIQDIVLSNKDSLHVLSDILTFLTSTLDEVLAEAGPVGSSPDAIKITLQITRVKPEAFGGVESLLSGMPSLEVIPLNS
jgi:hypothetical protein